MTMTRKFGLKHCKKCYLFLIVLGFIILITSISDKRFNISSDNLPWQISLLEDGNTKVFGITLNKTTVREALQTLNAYPEIAVFEHTDGRQNLEAYISSISLSGLTAKVILEYGVNKETMDRYIRGNINKEGTPSGAFKYKLNEEDSIEALNAPVISISYFPYAQFDDEIILLRFGVADEIIELNDKSSVYLYPKLGLSITYNLQEKDVLQYVSPAHFDRLRKLATVQITSH